MKGFVAVIAGLFTFALASILVVNFAEVPKVPEAEEPRLLRPHVALAHLPLNLDSLSPGNYTFAVEIRNPNYRPIFINGVLERCWPTACIAGVTESTDVAGKSTMMYPVELQVKKPGPFEVTVRIRYQGGLITDPLTIRGTAVEP